MSTNKQYGPTGKLVVRLNSACKQYDLDTTNQCLSSPEKKINYQTSFHTILSLKDYEDEKSYDLAQRNEMQHRSKHGRSTLRSIFARNSNTLTSSTEREVKCKSCSLVKDPSFYEWELIELHASQKAIRLRDDLKPFRMKGLLKRRVYSIDKGYLNARLAHLALDENNCIRNSFKRASEEDNPFYILTAYTTRQNFTKLVNTDMARNVIHDLTNGCSKFCCQCLYSTEDGTKSIATILLYHPQFQSLNYVGKVYRGLVIKELVFTHYTEGSYIITTTFLSTSKSRVVAEVFSGQDDPLPCPDDISVLCIYTIKNENRTALYIAEYSQFPEEEEILILPYSSFKITKIIRNHQQRRIEIHLEE